MIKLNLLPPEVKESIEFSKKNAALYNLLIWLVAIVISLFAIVGVVGYIVYKNKEVLTEENLLTAQQLASWNNVEADAKDFSERLNLVDKLRNNKIDWPLVFSEVAKSTPPNVRLTSFDFTNNSKERVSFTGFAATNTDIGTFRELISKSSIFEFVDIESVTAATDPGSSNAKVLAFKITMNLKQAEARK